MPPFMEGIIVLCKTIVKLVLRTKHSKQIRGYDFYTNGIREKLKKIEKKSWAIAVQDSFEMNPEILLTKKVLTTKYVVRYILCIEEAKYAGN
jgi:hypothetical protein